ncbi:sigma-70 family RNA polymerase sigma factor [bacterium]|nr:sigma-70 family RNA polymerase sigma factor [bacterium]
MALTHTDICSLAQRARGGDTQAFDALARHTRPLLVRLGGQWLREPHLAEELAQETLLRAYQRLGSLREPAAFVGWLTAIARNWALQRLRSASATEEVPLSPDEPCPIPDPGGDIALHTDLLTALSRLPEQQRAVARLCLLEQRSVAEVAAMLGAPPEVVKGRLQRARATLRKELRHLMPTSSKERPPLVLVVDDETHIARLIQVSLETIGYRVSVAHDGEAALALAQRQTPALVILDLLMPRMDGWTVLRHLRSERKTLLTPVLVVSALPPDEPRNALCHELADAYWQKPFSPLVLQAWVDRRLGRIAPKAARQLAQWRQLRFGGAATPAEVVPHLAADEYALVRVEARVLLAEMGSEATPALAAALHHADEGVWSASALILAQRDEPAAVEALTPLLQHDDQQRRWEALAAIGQMRNEAALLALADEARPVFEQVVAALDDPTESIRATAQAVLRRVKTPEAAVLLRDHSGGRQLRVRKMDEEGSVSVTRVSSAPRGAQDPGRHAP